MNILVGLTGSVASILFKKIVTSFQEVGNVQIVLTESAKNFVENRDMDLVECYDDNDEWNSWRNTREVLHISLRDWADVLVVAPASASTISKFSLGISDNLLTSVFSAWDFSKKVIIAPSMNTKMLTNPFVVENIEKLRKRCDFVDPQIKTLACGEHGNGAMANIEDIKSKIIGF